MTLAGQLKKALDSAAQRSLVERFLEQKAVEGTDSYLLPVGLSTREGNALSKLAERGWVAKSEDKSESGEDKWQLTKEPLSKVQINMVLHFPWSVFARRSDIPLDQATCFELIVTLKSQGWHEQSAAKVKKKKSHDPFADGVLAQLMKPVTVI